MPASEARQTHPANPLADCPVLLVDDEENLRRGLTEAFRLKGYRVTAAASAQEAVAALRSARFDVIVTDLILPDMDGIALMERTRLMQPGALVVLMTGQGTIDSAVKALKGGAYDYVLKPFRLEEMFLIVSRGLEQQRLRQENLWYEPDPLGDDRSDRARFRYRLRVGAVAPINDYVDAGFRLASGEDDLRSTNQSAGRNNPDFDPDSIFIDQAYVTFKAPKDWLGEGGSLKATGGKIANPFLWKNSKDYMLWDNDINPEGGAILLALKPAEMWTLYGNTGYFVLDENTAAEDPHVFGVQGGFGVTPTDTTELGARASWYEWQSLDGDFYQRGIDNTNLNGSAGSTSQAGGNLPGGLSDGSKFGAGELAAYFRYAGIEGWPIRVFGHYAQNLDAEDTLGADEEDTGWGGGLEIGDPKKFVLLGAGYYELEANFWPSQFTDSDLFDGVTNRKGWTVYAARQVFTNTELNLTLFSSDAIEDDVPPFADSVENSDRFRLQTDIVVKF